MNHIIDIHTFLVYVSFLFFYLFYVSESRPTLPTNTLHDIGPRHHLVVENHKTYDNSRLPSDPFWSVDYESVSWEPWMKQKVYDSCTIPPQSLDLPIKQETFLTLASRFPNVPDLHYVMFEDLRRYLSMSLESFQAQFATYTDVVIDVVKRPRLSLFIIGFSIVLLVVYFIILCSIRRGCRTCCSKAWCTLCCGFRERPNLRDYSVPIKALFFATVILFIVGELLLLWLGPLVVSSILHETQSSVCQVYRSLYTATFGIRYDQVRYNRMAGRRIAIQHQWKGFPQFNKDVAQLSANFTEVNNPDALVHDLNKISTESSDLVIKLLDIEVVDLSELQTSLSLTKTALGKIPDQYHMCLLCESSEDEEVNVSIQDAIKQIENEKTKVKDFSNKIDQKFVHNPAFKDAADIASSVIDVSKNISTYIPPTYRSIHSVEPTLFSVVSYARWSALGISLVSCICFICFLIAGCCVGLKYSATVTKYSAPLNGFLTFTWCSFFLWTTIIVFLSGVLLFISGGSGEPCLVKEDLLVKGKYAKYPLVVDIASHISKKPYDETLHILENMGSLAGNGRSDYLINITDIRARIDDSMNNAKNTIDTFRNDTRESLSNMEIEGMREKLTSMEWIYLIDFQHAPASELLAYTEVMLSGIQAEKKSIDTKLQTKMRELLNGTPLATTSIEHIYGLNDAESKINSVLKGHTDRKWCFIPNGNSDHTHDKVINGNFDIENDQDMKDLETKMQNYTEFKNSVKWMVRKMRILEVKPFTKVQKPGPNRQLSYEEYVQPGETLTPYLNNLTEQVTGSFSQSLLNITDIVVDKSNALIERFNQLADDGIHQTTVSLSLIAELLTVLDPVCKGVISGMATLAVTWLTLAVFQIIGGVITYKIWHYFQDLHEQDRRVKSQALIFDRQSREYIEMDRFVGSESGEVYITGDEVTKNMKESYSKK